MVTQHIIFFAHKSLEMKVCHFVHKIRADKGAGIEEATWLECQSAQRPLDEQFLDADLEAFNLR